MATRLELLLLTVLERGPRPSHAVVEGLRRRGDATPEWLVHAALRQLESARLVTSRRGRRRVYRLSPSGRARLRRERRAWLGLAHTVAVALGRA